MTHQKRLHISILVGNSLSSQTVIDDLWHRAAGSVDQDVWQVTGTAVYVHDGGSGVSPSGEGMSVVGIAPPREGPIASLAASMAGKHGPLGVAGRLLRDNLGSRRLAKTVARRKELVEVFCSSAVVVAADLTADRAVWQLRNRTGAELVHGPIAMLHAIRQTIRR